MSGGAARIWSNFKELLDVSWGSIADGQYLLRSGTSIIGVTPPGGGAPAAHATSHKSGGTDVVKLDELAAPTDITTLNATTGLHGLLPKLSGTATTYLDGTGVFSTPAGGGGVAYPAQTTTTATFTCPAFFATVSGVLIVSAPWLNVGDCVFVATAGKFVVSGKASNTSISLYNSADAGNASSGTIASGVAVSLVPFDAGEVPIFCYQDHFLTGSDGSYTNWTANGTGATKGQGVSSADHPGLFFLTTGTSVGAAATGYAFATAGNGYLYGTGALAFRCVFLAPSTKPIVTAANLSKIFLGMGTQPFNGAYPGADFAGFVFDPSSGMTNAANNWGILTRKASVSTYTDTGYAYSTTLYADLSFYLDSTGLYFRAYQWAGTAQAKSAAITSNVPLATTPLCLVFLVLNGASGTTSYQSFIDSWEVAYRGNTVIPAFRGSQLLKNF